MAASPRFTFGPYELEPRSAQLRRGKRFVPLTAKAFRLLQSLVERPGELLTKEELLAAVWPRGGAEATRRSPRAFTKCA